MRGPIPMILLCGGLCLALASGARHGDAWTAQRADLAAAGELARVASLEGAERAEAEARLREAGLLGPAVSDADRRAAAQSLLSGPEAPEAVRALQGAGLLHRDTSLAQAVAEARMRLNDHAREAKAGREPPPRDPRLMQAVSDDPAVSEAAVRALWAEGELNPPPTAADALALLSDPQREPRVLAALGDRLPAGDTVEARLSEARAARAPLGPSARLAGWWAVSGPGWLLGVGMVAAGALLARRGGAQAAAAQAASGGADFLQVVRALRAELPPLRLRLQGAPADDTAPEVRAALDRLRLERIEPLVAARAALIQAHGVAAFTEYFSPFSAAERKLARAWSALTDGQPAEADRALDEADRALVSAEAAWGRVSA